VVFELSEQQKFDFFRDYVLKTPLSSLFDYNEPPPLNKKQKLAK
jgi:hypothetical protein